ncbi:MAG: Ig-like domain-containing protein [Candidatus Krumholzibacteria bacterium]|nr:Ig-like domain-containing protein [Candidatus Krumholzibacteria bacterium]
MDTFVVTVTAVNDSPMVVAAIPDTTVDEDNPPIDNYRDLNDVFADIEDGNALSFAMQSNSDSSLVAVVIDADSAVDLTFAADQNGSATIVFRATDSGGFSVDDTLVVTVSPTNDPPTVTSAIPDTTVIQDNAPIDSYRDLNEVFSDIEDGPSLNFAIQGNTNPALVNAIIDADSALDLSFTPGLNGTATITIRAIDSGGLFAQDTLVVAVKQKPSLIDVAGSLYPNSAFVNDPQLALRIGVDNTSATGITLATTTRVFFSDGINDYWATLTNPTYVPANATNFTLTFSSTAVPSGIAAPDFYDLRLDLNGADDNSFSHTDTVWTTGRNSIFVDTPKIRLSALPLDVETVFPGQRDATILLLDLQNGYADDRFLDSLIIFNTSLGSGSAAQLDGEIEVIRLFDDVDSSRALSAADTLVASSSFDANTALFSIAGSWRVPGSSHRTLIATAHVDSFLATDGDHLDVALLSAADIVFQGNTLVADDFSPLYPADSFGRLVIDGMVPHQISITASAVDTLESGTTDNWVVTLVAPQNGYQVDTLMALAIKNYAADFSPSDISAWHLYQDTGDGVFDPVTDASLGQMVYSGDLIEISGLNQPIVTDLTLFITADVALDATDGDHFQPGIPINGIEVVSANDGPNNVPVVLTKSFTIRRLQKIDIANLPLSPYSPHPGDGDAPLLLLAIGNNTLMNVQLDTLTLTNATTGVGTGTDLDNTFLDVKIIEDDGDGVVDATDNVVREGLTFVGGSVTVTGLGLSFTPGATKHLLIAAHFDSSCSSDGDTVSVRVPSPSSLGFDQPLSKVGTFPMATPTPLVLDGMMAHQISVAPSADSLLISAGMDVLLFDFAVPANGYQIDTLQSIHIQNLGSANSEHFARLALYRDGGNGTFDAGIGDDSYLGDFVEDPTQPGGRDYDITGLSDPLVNTCGNLARYFVVSDITSDYTVGGSIQFAIPIQGLQLASANDGPIDQSVQDPSIQVLPKPDQLTIFPYSVSDQTVYPGSTKNLNFGVGFYNGYTFPLQLQQLKVFQAGTAASTEIDSVFAYADIDSNGLFDPVADSLVAVVASSGISYTLSQLDLQLAPQQISYVFISYDLSLSIRDSVTVDLKMFDVDGISVNPAGTDIQGEFPVNSPGVDTSDGMIARQILLHPVPVVRAAPGDADVLVLAMTVPPNGILPDVLDFVSIGNLGSASPGADIALVRLWKESGGDANNFDPADDDMLTTLNWNGTTWTNPGALGEIIPLAATRLYVTFSVSNAPSDGATLRASVPLNGIQVASGNDGPIDAFIANPTEQSVSTDPLITSLTTDLGSYSVGQAMSLVMSVRNEGVDTLLGITPSAISVLGSAAVSLSSGPTPISLDLLPGADSVFVWNYVTNAAGDIHFCGYAHSGDSLFVSQETCSQDAQVQNRASAIPTSLSNFAPATANRGQDNVTMFKLKLTYDDFDSLSAAVELDGLRLVIEDEAGNPIPPNTVVDRLSFLAAGGINYSFSLIDSTSNPLQLYVPTPIVIPASDSLVLNITCDVGENAAFVAYRVSVAAPGDIRVADRNDGLPVPLSSGESFPWSTTSVVLNQSADSLLVSSDTSSTLSANTGQDDVRLFSLSMLNRGDANAASVIVTDMTLEFFDSTGAPLPPDQAIRALHAVSNGQTLFTTQIIPDGDNTLSMNLGTPLILAPGVLEYLDIVVDLSAVPQTGSFYSTVAAPSSVVARDINTAQIVGTYAMNPSIADFPFASNRIFFETPASALLASFVDRMPPSILPSTFGAPVADLALGHVDSAMSSSLVLDSLAVLFTDASSGPIFPGDYFSKVYVVHGADTLSQVTSLSSTQPIAECKLLPPIVIAPAETDTISVLVDTKAVFAPTVFEVWLDRQHLVVFDQNDGSRMLGISGTFPFVAGPATLQLPSTQVAAGLASRLPQNVATREAGVQAFDLLLRNGNPPGHTTVALQSLAVNIRDAKGNTLEPSKLLSGARLLKADSLIAVGQLNGGNVTFLFAGSAPLVPAAAVDTLSLEVDVDAQMSDVNFQFVIADGNAIRLTDVVTGDTLTTATINNIGFPLRSTFTHILGNSPEAAFTNYPNPFAAGKQGTRITYKLAQTATVTLKLYTVWGNHVRTLIDNKTQSPGLYQDVAWDGQNADGDVVNNGVYFLILEIHGANGSHAKFRRKVGVVR